MDTNLIKTPNQIKFLRKSGKILALVHAELKINIKPQVTTLFLDSIAEKLIRENGAKPSFKGFGGFKHSICSSVNSVIVHGVPDRKKLIEGDIISIDVGVNYKGMHTDAAFTIGVGNISKKAEMLLSETKRSLEEAIKLIKDGTKLGDIGFLINSIAKEGNYEIAKDYAGHGIGTSLHEDPLIPNSGIKGVGFTLKENMVICVEPMFIDGPDNLITDKKNKWSVKSKQGNLTAHFEHTILVKKNGYDILTKKQV